MHRPCTREYAFELLSRMKPRLEEEFHIGNIGVFGSIAKGNYTDKSDVDILVDYKKTITLFRLAALTNFLEGILHRPVEIVSRSHIKSALKESILNEVVLL